MKYIVKRIQEADFGCEERPEGIGAMVLLRLRDVAGHEIDLEVPDDDLLAQDINEGDWVFFDKDDNIHKE
ncbi:MAG: hypothetical protein II765_02720 [Lachnospiraceae bacterium]|nr:hypothetical protein [Lachnospiraceae bacterium]